MKAKAAIAVFGLLGLGLAISAGLAWLLRGGVGRAGPAAILPPDGLIVSLSGEDLPDRFDALRRFPLYHALFSDPSHSSLGRRLGWSREVPSPWPRVPRAVPAAVGLYREGWIVVQPKGDATRAGASRDEGEWTLVASSPSLLDRKTGDPGATLESRIPVGSVRIEANLSLFLSGNGGASLRSVLGRLLPDEASGTIRVEGKALSERWTFSCSSSCLFDLLDPGSDGGIATRGWPALPERATAAAWFRLQPEKLREQLRGTGESDRPGVLGNLEHLERFLGLPIRDEMASALAGPGIAAVIGDSDDAPPRLLAVLDLASPSTAREVLDRAAALGLLTGSVRVGQYRGVRIVRWASGASRGSFEPSAAVDEDLLLLATRAADLEDAIDRRHDSGPDAPNPLREDLERLRSGAWKGSLRAASAPTPWESLAGLSAARQASSGDVRATAVLYREDGQWILEGGGDGPAIIADGVSPAIAGAFRGR